MKTCFKDCKLDLKRIETSKNGLVFANKTTYLYDMSPDQCNSLLKNNISKTYRKQNSSTKPELINNEEAVKTFGVRQ